MAFTPSIEMPNLTTPSRIIAPTPMAFELTNFRAMPATDTPAPAAFSSSTPSTPVPPKRKSSTSTPAPDHFDSVEDAERFLKRPKGRGRPRKDVAAALQLARDMVQGQQPIAPEPALQIVEPPTGQTAHKFELGISATLSNAEIDFKPVRQRIVKGWKLLIRALKHNHPLVFDGNYRRHLAKLPSAQLYKEMEDELIVDDGLPEWAVREMPWMPSADSAQEYVCKLARNTC